MAADVLDLASPDAVVRFNPDHVGLPSVACTLEPVGEKRYIPHGVRGTCTSRLLQSGSAWNAGIGTQTSARFEEYQSSRRAEVV